MTLIGRCCLCGGGTVNLKAMNHSTGATLWNRSVNTAVTDAAGDVWDFSQTEMSPGLFSNQTVSALSRTPLADRQGNLHGSTAAAVMVTRYESTVRKYAGDTGTATDYSPGFWLQELATSPGGCLRTRPSSRANDIYSVGQLVNNSGHAFGVTDDFHRAGVSATTVGCRVWVADPSDSSQDTIATLYLEPFLQSGVTALALAVKEQGGNPSVDVDNAPFNMTDDVATVKSKLEANFSTGITATVTSSAGASGTPNDSYFRIVLQLNSAQHYVGEFWFGTASSRSHSPVKWDLPNGQILTYGDASTAPVDPQWCSDGEAFGLNQYATDNASDGGLDDFQARKVDTSSSPWSQSWTSTIGSATWDLIGSDKIGDPIPGTSNFITARVRDVRTSNGYIRIAHDPWYTSGGDNSFGYYAQSWTNAGGSHQYFSDRVSYVRELATSDTTQGFAVLADEWRDRYTNPWGQTWQSLEGTPSVGYSSDAVRTSKQSVFWFEDSGTTPVRGFAMGANLTGSVNPSQGLWEPVLQMFRPFTFVDLAPPTEDVRVFGNAVSDTFTPHESEEYLLAWSYDAYIAEGLPRERLIDTQTANKTCSSPPPDYKLRYIEFYQYPAFLVSDAQWKIRFFGAPGEDIVETSWLSYSTSLSSLNTELSSLFGTGTICGTPSSPYVHAQIGQKAPATDAIEPTGGTGMLWQEGLHITVELPTDAAEHQSSGIPDNWSNPDGEGANNMNPRIPYVQLWLRNITGYTATGNMCSMELDNTIDWQRNWGTPAIARATAMMDHDDRLYVRGAPVRKELEIPA